MNTLWNSGLILIIISTITIFFSILFVLCPFGLQLFWRLRFCSAFFSFFFFWFNRNSWLCQLWTVHLCTIHRSHKLYFSATFLLKMGLTALFTHLKIISLQCFQFQFLVSAKISSIQTYSLCTFWSK